ncbi:uncharacterized protein LOC112639582 isoform X1 [Camponotus floridanus]|uniref:uncharacterized protein LOC112639582 isoform X1 n=1 Tax=Camponotus floridanus TaxID=104421 RepID=UPI000DC6CB88|nr:uncharacterized protein LOC112639582 isoform X1 [Camponotus floridanus]
MKSCRSRTYIYNTRTGKEKPSVLRINEKTVGGRERFLTWLKDIFNKSIVAEDRSHEADTSIVTIDRATTTLDHPEITVPKPPADSSGKVGVINQKLTNFNAIQSMTKFVDGNFRTEKYHAENDKKCANAIQQSTTYISSQSSELGKILQRETDSNFAWFDPGEVHRSERITMKFATRDSDAAAHYHRYTSPRHCYRLPPRIKRPFLESCALNRNIGVSTRAIADFAPRNSKPPVREPNMPKKEKDEKKDKKEKKKPVIRTDGESADSSENRAKMIANDNPKSDLDTGFHEWGVKLVEEPAAEASDNDNLAEKSRQYVTKQFWGVNLKRAKPDVEDVPSPASEGPRRAAKEHRNTSPISESSDTIVDETRSNASSSLNASTKVPSNLKGTTAEYLSTPSYQANLISPSSDSIMPQQGKTDADSSLNSEALQRIIKASPDVLKEPITIEEYNVPEGATLNTEITAWKILAMRSNTVAQEDHMSPDNVENMEMLSIRPEAPQPKLDVRVVKSAEDALEDDHEIDQISSGYKAVKPTEIKHFGSPQKPDGYVSSKRLHTASMQIRYTHRYISRYIATLSINSVLIDKTTRMRCSRFTSAFSTNPENSKEIIKILNQQGKEKLDSKSWKKEERSNDSNNSLSIKRPHLASLESRTFSNSSKKPSDTDNLAETLNVIANKEMEISLKESQTTDHRKKIARLSSEPAQKDESRFKDEDVQDEIERYENSTASYIDSRKDATYIDFETPSADPIKSPNAKLNEEDSNIESDKNATLNPNVEDVKDEYIVDGDYVRFPGDPYPYNKENLDKWRASRFIHRPAKPVKPETKFDSVSVTQSRNTNGNVYANVPRDSHAGAAMKTSGSGDGAGAKNAGHSGSGFRRVSPRSQRAVSDCLRGDAADVLGLRGWTEAFSRLDVGGEMDGAAVRRGGGGDDASSRVYHQ